MERPTNQPDLLSVGLIVFFLALIVIVGALVLLPGLF